MIICDLLLVHIRSVYPHLIFDPLSFKYNDVLILYLNKYDCLQQLVFCILVLHEYEMWVVNTIFINVFWILKYICQHNSVYPLNKPTTFLYRKLTDPFLCNYTIHKCLSRTPTLIKI